KPITKSSSGVNKKLKDSGKIAVLLKYFHQDRILARVHLPSDTNEYNSAIISADREHKTFDLDELTPEEGNPLLLKDHHVTINAQVRGISVHFEAELKHSKTSSGVALHTFHFPKVVEYLQRRSFFRAKLSAGNPISFSGIHPDTRKRITGNLTDISIQGIGATIYYNGQIYRGEKFKSCRLTLPNHETISLSIEVKQVKKIKTNSQFHIGCIFSEIDSNARKKIERMIRTIERKQLRSKKKR
ncbi:MAG: hypothetical protein HOM11_16985, partial [Methylococcales bacterium]|nr:hypothetical protein [Methylococcales bacterium]